MKTNAIRICEPLTLTEMKAVEAMQRDVWGVADLEVIPSYFMKVARDTGGMLLGAYDGATLVGFVFGILARDGDATTIHSDMLAVSPAYRDRQLGHRLKLAQREWCLARGIERVTWTFDPLQTRNARLNFGKLGAVCDQYKVNYYGETTSALHQLGTDRLWLRWELASDRVARRLAGERPALPVTYQPDQALVHCTEQQIPAVQQPAPSATVFIEVPGDINTLQETDRALAARWREATRQVFTGKLSAGYRVVNFSPLQRNNQRVGVYELCRQE